MESTASVLFSQPIDLSSVVLFPATGANLVVLDITNQTSPQVVPSLNITTSPAAGGAQSLNIIPTSGFWTKGHHYGILVVGGPNGLKGASSGQTVTGSPTWALVSGSAPVLACDAQGNNCRPGLQHHPRDRHGPRCAVPEPAPARAAAQHPAEELRAA